MLLIINIVPGLGEGEELMLELSLEQEQRDFVSVHGHNGQFSCAPEIRSPLGDVAALVKEESHLLWLCWLFHTWAPCPVPISSGQC